MINKIPFSIDVQSSNEKSDKEAFDLLENSENLSIHHLDTSSVDMLQQTYNSHATSPPYNSHATSPTYNIHATSPMSATSHMSAFSHDTSSVEMSPPVVSSTIDDANLMEEGKVNIIS